MESRCTRGTARQLVCAVTACLLVGVLLAACSGAAQQSSPTGDTVSPADCASKRRSASPPGRLVTLFHETHTHGSLAGTPERPHDIPFARYVGLRNALRACLPEPEDSLFLGNGDDISLGIDNVRTDGRHTVDAFNAAGIDADTFGFSEVGFGESYGSFEEGLAHLRALVAASDFTWVSANVRDAREPERTFAAAEGARLWVIEEVGGVRVGVTGLLSAEVAEGRPALPLGGDSSVRVLDPVEAMREVVPRMRAGGAEIIVVLSHMHEQDTFRVVRSVDAIDVALGTHAGDATPHPEVVNGAIVAVAGPDELQALGQLDLTIRDGEIVDYAFQRHVPAASGPVDRRVEAVVEGYLRRG